MAEAEATAPTTASETVAAEVGDEKKEAVEVFDHPRCRMPVDVFVRLRPLLAEESEEKETKWKVLSAKDGTRKLAITRMVRSRERTEKFSGFNGVIRPTQDNLKTFKSCIEPLLPSVLEGNTTCAFAYGHSGSGKSHTILGYDAELGMYRQATAWLFARLESIRETTGISLQIGVRFADLYMGKVKDLLGGFECAVREDADGSVHIRGPVHKDASGRVTVQPLSAVLCKNESEVIAAVESALKKRTVGESTIHDLSSRSHAVVELEIVSDELVAARKCAIEAEGDVVPVGHERDGERIRQGMVLFNSIKERVYRERPELKDAGESEVNSAIMEIMRDLSEDERNALDTGSGELLDRLNAEVSRLDGLWQKARERVEASKSTGPKCVGGMIVFVDLAGNEFGVDDRKSKGGAQRAERKSINTSLFALKECIRALHKGADHVPYRNSKLTRVLRKHFEGRHSSALMIATVSPRLDDALKTKNTLDYSSLVAEA